MNHHNHPNEYADGFANGWRHGYASALRYAISVLEPCDDAGAVRECLRLLKAQMLNHTRRRQWRASGMSMTAFCKARGELGRKPTIMAALRGTGRYADV